ncbi:histidine phosphatase family protein [Marimonas sp. MJW-29]|uniref:Histidine phosphatase family protein n=1 Tax=Sulfitobacter sediminis TaxID=3234186 RepID=A0ABV3RUA0_9RHOB
MIRLALLRHGHTEWNRAGRIQGRTDVPLDDEATRQLTGLRLPEAWEEADIFASPLSRAIDTARLVADRAPRIDPALIEMNWGDWEGLRAAELYADPGHDYRHVDDWGWHYTPPGGESPAALRARLLPWLATRDRDTVAVCHIGVMRVMLALASDWHFNGPPPFQIKRNRLYVLEVAPGKLTLLPDPVRLIERAP